MFAVATVVEDRIEKINNYQLTDVKARILRDGSLSPHIVDEAITEFRKFMCLIADGHTGMGMISPEVDEVWHTFILFTRDYMQFCDDVFGQYIHHQPAAASLPRDVSSGRRFLDAYERAFGPVPAIWLSQRSDSADCSSADCTPVPSCSGDSSPTRA